ncbi:MAG: hypothetical protein Kow0099_35190 [Candidatus Abyssubacteria bacterium]
MTLQEIDAFHAFLTEPKAEVRQTPSIDVGLYDSPGAATDRTIPLGDRIPLILVHGSSSDIISDGEYGRELNDLERWIDYIRAFNADPAFSSRYKVYRFVYDSRLGIAQNGANLVTVLDTLTSYPGWEGENLDGKNFVILAHSMGGLVSRAAMNMQFSVGTDAGHYLGDHVINLVTLGTPHRGSPLAIPAWVYDSVKRGSMMSETEFYFTYILHLGFVPTEGEFDLAWDNYDDAVPQTDITTYEHLLIPVLKDVGGGRDQHEKSVFSPYPDALNSADAFTGKLVLYCAQNPPEADVDTLLELAFYYSIGFLTEHHLLGFTSNKLAGQIAGDIGEGGVKPYGNNDGLVPFASAVFDGETVAYAETLDKSDHLSLLDKSAVITTVKAMLISIATPE